MCVTSLDSYKCREDPSCEFRGGIEVHSYQCFIENGKKWDVTDG